MSIFNTHVGPYSVFGTKAAPKTLTASYVVDTNGIQLFDGFRQCHIEVVFAEGTVGEEVEVKVETSNDEGHESPTVFYPFSENNYPDATPNPTQLGVEPAPYSFAETGSYVIKDISGPRWLRFSARSSVASSFGTAFIRVRFSE